MVPGSKENSAMHINKCHFNKRWILMNRTRECFGVAREMAISCQGATKKLKGDLCFHGAF